MHFEDFMKNQQQRRWWLELILFSGFLLSFFLDLTGVDLHQWLGMLVGGLALFHLLNHWDWVEAVSQRLHSKVPGKTRLYYWLDAALFLGFSIMLSTGILISTWLNLDVAGTALLSIHILSSILSLAITLIKLSAHWKWLGSTTRSIFKRSNLSAGPQLSPTQTNHLNRREFFKVMGAVSLASLIALSSAGRSLMLLKGEETIETVQANNSTSTDTSQAQVPSSSSACSIRCGKRCSYPGHCRRYTDSNNNGRCDLGECL
jgi:hypothetical protein